MYQHREVIRIIPTLFPINVLNNMYFEPRSKTNFKSQNLLMRVYEQTFHAIATTMLDTALQNVVHRQFGEFCTFECMLTHGTIVC